MGRRHVQTDRRGDMYRQTGEEMCTHGQERRDGHMDRGDV